nr:MAG TPA: TFIIH basal transcription factor complex-p62, General transcription factor IIH [Bacteriophage sp.]
MFALWIVAGIVVVLEVKNAKNETNSRIDTLNKIKMLNESDRIRGDISEEEFWKTRYMLEDMINEELKERNHDD